MGDLTVPKQQTNHLPLIVGTCTNLPAVQYHWGRYPYILLAKILLNSATIIECKTILKLKLELQP